MPRGGYRITILKDLAFTQRLRKKETEFLLQNKILYNVFSALFIAVGYIVAQARQVQNFYQAIRRCLFKCREGYWITILKDMEAQEARFNFLFLRFNFLF